MSRAPHPTSPQPAPARGRLRISIFIKLIVVMLVMMIGLLVIGSAFISLIGRPNLGLSEALFEGLAQVTASTSPDAARAQQLGKQLSTDIAYDGPRGAWATAAGLPTIDDAVRHRAARGGKPIFHLHRLTQTDSPPPPDGTPMRGWARGLRGRDFYLVSNADGGTYMFAWDYRRQVIEAHNTLLLILLASLTAVVVITYGVLRWLLRPVRLLDEGVARLSDGQLDVVLPSRTRDEFGALTDGFNLMVGRVRDMIRARDQLLLDVSHELRSPLTRMKVALELLPDSSQRTRMSADVVEMETMVAELLELERLRDGRGIGTTRQDLLPILRDVADGFQDRAPGVRLASAATTFPADIDERTIRIVFRNLLENATKYSFADSRPIEIAVAQHDQSIVIRMTDDGPGIPESDLGHLFEPFFRVDRSRSKKTGGYGLGLSICKRIVEAHGGRIAVENNIAQGAAFGTATRGTTFIVTLPRPA
jgi:signal transduction histidine kinase